MICRDEKYGVFSRGQGDNTHHSNRAVRQEVRIYFSRFRCAINLALAKNGFIRTCVWDLVNYVGRTNIHIGNTVAGFYILSFKRLWLFKSISNFDCSQHIFWKNSI